MKLEDFKTVYTDYRKYKTAPDISIIKPVVKTIEVCIQEIYGNLGLSYIKDFIEYKSSMKVLQKDGTFLSIRSEEELWSLLESYRLCDYFENAVIQENKEIKQSSIYREYDLGWGPI